MLATSAATSVTGSQTSDRVVPTIRRRPKPVPVTRPLPMHHASKTVRVENMPHGWTARVVFLRKPDGSVEPYAPLVVYMTDHWSRSATWQDTLARGVGLLWDFFQAHAPAHEAAKSDGPWRRTMFRKFALALVTGTIDIKTKHDPLALYWPHMPRARAMLILRALEGFRAWYYGEWLDWPEANRSQPADPVLPRDALSFSDMLIWSRISQTSMLEHLTSPRKIRRAAPYHLGPAPNGTAVQPVKFFPPNLAGDLLFKGHKRQTKRGMQPTNVRDQLITLLCMWGGLRRSEAFHLWVTDVTVHPEKPDVAMVILHHPSESKFEYPDVFRQNLTVTRKEYLNRKCGLEPRNLVNRGRYHAGWKGMELDSELRSLVHWLDEDAGRVFLYLFEVYQRDRARLMRLRRDANGVDHPFLFVSEGSSRREDDTSLIGDPYSMKAYERNHRAAVKRLGIPFGKKHGTATHGLRHAYGQGLMDLRLPSPVIKKALHHRSYLSQAVYTAPTDAKIDLILRAAKERLAEGGDAPFDLRGSEDSLALYDLSEHINSGVPRV